ncbi:hypothetical protein EVA_12997 [gut metagenome]|uniref:Uncharacterized protein n=1 Tax=gut metagenome TaxID=749906 RepID=J9GHI0_9ZZZZ
MKTGFPDGWCICEGRCPRTWLLQDCSAYRPVACFPLPPPPAHA